LEYNETYSKVHTGKHLSDKFLTQNGLKQDVLSPLHFNSALEYAIRKVQENGHATAQAVSRWLPTAAARVQTWVWSCGIL
jgi:ABC-type proline/glycine betaine transport system substrate-binding protein